MSADHSHRFERCNVCGLDVDTHQHSECPYCANPKTGAGLFVFLYLDAIAELPLDANTQSKALAFALLLLADDGIYYGLDTDLLQSSLCGDDDPDPEEGGSLSPAGYVG